jgi:hypothetical protein
VEKDSRWCTALESRRAGETTSWASTDSNAAWIYSRPLRGFMCLASSKKLQRCIGLGRMNAGEMTMVWAATKGYTA